MPSWVPVVVAALLGLVTLAIQGAMLAYFIGRMRESAEGQRMLVATFQAFTEKAIDGLITRMGKFDDTASDAKAERATLDLRLSNLETNTNGLAGLRETMAAFRATYDAHAAAAQQAREAGALAITALQRQVANLGARQARAGATNIRHLDKEIEEGNG